MNRFLLLFFLFFSYNLTAQIVINGVVYSETDTPISNVGVSIKDSNKGVVTDLNGRFSLEIDSKNVLLVFNHISYEVVELNMNEFDVNSQIIIHLAVNTQLLNSVNITGVLEKNREQASVTMLDPITIETLPSPFNDISKVLASLPGVISNNELSTTYSVRGGSFQENLVYVNDIPIYRPQLASAGRQEGLSFVNSKLINNISFSAGGWQPKYGDKLSSSLNVEYKEPRNFAASTTLSLLGADVHFENNSKNDRINYVIGVRHKRAEYLLNSLETKGEYKPRFTDLQSFVNFNIGPKNNISKTKIGLLVGYARNRYNVVPKSKETEFGTFNQALRLYVAFDGKELVQYDTYQGGVKLTHNWNNRIKSHMILSGVSSYEKEYRDLEGAYRLCDIDNRPGSNSFNECVVTRGIGSNYQHSRNILSVKLLNVESRNEITLNDNNQLEFGLGYGLQIMEDVLDEYSFRDSSDFIIDYSSLQQENNLRYESVDGYIQNTSKISTTLTITEGVRFYYTDRNKKLLVSPRLQIGFEPKSFKRDIVLRSGIGLYQQPAFYRELRNFDGTINKRVDAQTSWHFILGMDQNLTIWGRGFKLTTEGYYKYYPNIIPYDVDNIRLRYYANTSAKGYATGLDVRLSGEFIPGTVSWFSLGILSTKENLITDNREYIRRPTDQRLNFGVYFQDHLPNDPTWRVNLSLLLGTGLPFGPPSDINARNSYTGGIYRRVDIGFVKEVFFGNVQQHSVLIGLEVLNLLGTENTISYSWIEDAVGQEFAVPNTLSTRFLNLKLTVKI